MNLKRVSMKDKDEKLGKIIASSLDSKPHAGVCPSEDLLAAFVDGSAGREEKALIYMHIASCSRCRETVSIVASLRQTEAPGLRKRIVKYIPYAVAASIALVLGVAYLGGHPGNVRQDTKIAKLDRPALVMPQANPIPEEGGDKKPNLPDKPTKAGKHSARVGKGDDEYYVSPEDEHEPAHAPVREERPDTRQHLGVLYAMATLDTGGRLGATKSLSNRRTVTDPDEIENIIASLRVHDRQMRKALEEGVVRKVVLDIGDVGVSGQRGASLKLDNGVLTITVE